MNLEELRTRLGTTRPAPVVRESAASPEAIPGGMLEQTNRGPCLVVETTRGHEEEHGSHQFMALRGLRPFRIGGVLAGIGQDGPHLERVAYLDTETTGLGYGAGVQVFMVGIGSAEPDGFRVRQFVLRHPGEEPALLLALSEYLSGFDILVSYNGRAFDWPLLENRLILNRVPPLEAQPVHLDLLYLARRLWRARLESCGMSTVEQAILGVDRGSKDVPGYVIPSLYFQFVRTGSLGLLRRILHHNLYDILSLAVLTAHVERVLADPWGGTVSHAVDFYSLGRLYNALGEVDGAVACFETALSHDLPPSIRDEAVLRLAMIEKRRSNWQMALPLFESILDRSQFERIACVELAKYHEHVAREFGPAMQLTDRALRADGRLDRWPGTDRMELLHRKRRLSGRVGNVTPGPSPPS